ncbi:histidine phosphatase family protein [Secundilactobacillus odoratitofui]|uniref:histidine phosphatase family protein n=1 Tax=Secundilactobacillus odoratitofui TaxID=480930 RepID=UPI0006D10A84|nr:histidine phosphatase family protein [Secundilactobacillus odoratitofui]
MANFDIYLVRHGQTILNKYHRIQGWIDAPLTEKGVADAKAAGARLADVAFTKAFTSDAPRAQRTAAHILAQNSGTVKTATINTAFREENFGYFEGNDDVQTWHMIGGPEGHNTFNDIITAYSIEKSKDMIHNLDPFKDAEDNATFWARLQPGFDDLITNCVDGDKVLITSHGTTIRSIVSRFNPAINIAVSAQNGSVTKLSVHGDAITVDYYNRVDAHLD